MSQLHETYTDFVNLLDTGKVGLASVACASIQAVNPEIAALQQHQDPAGEGAQALNKEIASELARQIASVGGDPALANEASTFAPGELDDATAAGNTCNDENDDEGCINSLGLRVDDLSADEIAAAVADVGQAADAEAAAPAAKVDNNLAAACAALNANATAPAVAVAEPKAAKGAEKAAQVDVKAPHEAAKAEAEAAKAADKAAKADDKAAAKAEHV
jgi:hypothetical protein